MPDSLRCHELTKFFGTTCAVTSASFRLEAGGFMALLGPSGCGKTTILRMIAGLEVPDQGEIYLNEKLVAKGNKILASVNNRRVGLVFQDYALFPHKTVEQNVAYGVGATNIPEILALVGLSGLEKRYPQQLSGGQQQRVALARALAPQPTLLLMDEPFSNLDAALRGQVRQEVRRIIKESGVSAILVTHDQDEALSIADQIAVMLDGSIAQIGDPQTVYENPVSEAVTLFLGEANILRGEAHGDTVNTALGQLPLREARSGKVNVLIRPEDLLIEAGTNAIVEDRIYFGHRQTICVRLSDGTPLKINSHTQEIYQSGQAVGVKVRGAVLAFN